jgi:thioredoxin 2
MNDSIVRCPACGTKNRIPSDKSRQKAKCGKCGRPLGAGSPGRVVELDDHSFDSTLRENPLPVLVDFYSPTCGPCQMLAPLIEALARDYKDRLLVAKIDTSRHQMIAARHQIRGVPTLIFFKQGRKVDQLVGAAPREEIERKIKALL